MNNSISVDAMYSDALFQVILENQLNKNKYLEETDFLLEIFKQEKDFIYFLNSLSIKNADKFLVIDEVFKNDLSEEMLNFVKIIVKNSHINEINAILLNLKKIILNSENIVEGIVYSTNKLDKETIDKISNKINSKLNKTVKLKNLIDKSLISGIKIVVEDLVIENSFKSKINQLKKQILEGDSNV